MNPVRGWLRATIDEKPWWAIIVAALLGAIGSEAVKAVPTTYTWLRSLRPIKTTAVVSIKYKGTERPVEGAVVSVLDVGDMKETGEIKKVFLNSEGAKAVRTRSEGLAKLTLNVMPGPYYAIFVEHVEGNITYRLTKPVTITESAQHSIEFDQHSWSRSQETASFTPTQLAAGPSPVAPNVSGALPGWMNAAYAELGQSEIPGSADNPRIIQYIRSVPGAKILNEEIPWNSAFVNWALTTSSIKGTNSLVARSWMTWGKNQTPPSLGCIAVFWNGSPDSPTGHVGFYVGEADDRISVLGGNQSNQVSIAAVPRARFLGCRVP